ncbi:aminotransferase class IV [Microcoleus sp. FACHB-1515]|nr:aminotransferase class IV [Microcoleus sp. FACHB-1515]
MLGRLQPLIWHNGDLVPREQADPSIASHSLHLGIGVFDGIMAYRNQDHYYIHRLAAHLDRFRHSAQQIGLGFSWSTEELTSGISALLAALPAQTYYLRPIAYRAVPHLNFREEMPVEVSILVVGIDRDRTAPIACHVSPYQRISGLAVPIRLKLCGTYINSYLSRRTAEQQGFQDAILLDAEGRITEATAANLFLLQGDRLLTPALTPSIFPGITRATIFELCDRLGIEAIEANLTIADLNSCEGGFLAATMIELKPLGAIHPHRYDSANHPLFQQILQEFQEIMHQ